MEIGVRLALYPICGLFRLDAHTSFPHVAQACLFPVGGRTPRPALGRSLTVSMVFSSYTSRLIGGGITGDFYSRGRPRLRFLPKRCCVAAR